MYMTHPWLQEGAGGITASLGTCPGVLVTAASSLALSGALGFSRVKPQGGSHWNFWLVYVHQMAPHKVRGAASMDLGDEHNSQVALSLVQRCLYAVL